MNGLKNTRSNNRIMQFLKIKELVASVLVVIVFSSHAKHDVVEFSLRNRLRVICIKKKSAQTIFFSIWYRCGSKNDAISRSGVAHYLEHMAFAINKMEFNNILEDIGAEKNAFTSINTICFHENVPKEHIEEVFKHEAKRMVSFNIDSESFLAEKGAILEERSMRVDNDPGGAAQESTLANIFNREIGGIGIIGWRYEIEAITEKDLYKFHDKWFAPNNAMIIISGDFDLDHIKKLAEEYFGKIPPKQLKNKEHKVAELPDNILKEIKYSSPKNGSTSSVEYIFSVPFLSKENLRKSITLDIAIMALNRPAFFVKKILKGTTNCATQVLFGYVDRVFQHDIVVLGITSPFIDSLYDAENMWGYFKEKFVQDGISETELAAVKQQYRISLAYKEDDIVEISNHFGWLLICGYSVAEILEIDNIVQSVTIEECNNCLKEVFSQKPWAISRVEPKGYYRE